MVPRPFRCSRRRWPTLLMGASLPAVARWVETTPKGVSWLGFFYGGNIAGAVLGCLLAGFYLLRLYDMPTATAVAVTINVAVSLISFILARKAPYQPMDVANADSSDDTARRRRTRKRAAARATSRALPPSAAFASCTWRSRFRACARWARKWSGHACFR